MIYQLANGCGKNKKVLYFCIVMEWWKESGLDAVLWRDRKLSGGWRYMKAEKRDADFEADFPLTGVYSDGVKKVAVWRQRTAALKRKRCLTRGS